jgi:hypothetical protein
LRLRNLPTVTYLGSTRTAISTHINLFFQKADKLTLKYYGTQDPCVPSKEAEACSVQTLHTSDVASGRTKSYLPGCEVHAKMQDRGFLLALAQVSVFIVDLEGRKECVVQL